MKIRQVILNLAFDGTLFNTTVKEWVDPTREGDARNATEADLLIIGDSVAAGYVAQITALESAHVTKIAEIEAQKKEQIASLESAHAAAIAKMQEDHATALATAIPAPQPAAHISKLTLMHRLNALGKWPAFKSLLTHLPEIVQDAWHLAQSISPADPLFVDAAPQIKAALELTDEQFDTLLFPG